MVNPYEQYDTYSQGEDWDYNDEIQRLFEDRVAKETIGNRPTASEAPDNAIFKATDENLIYRNDPTNGWVVIGFGTQGNEIPQAFFDSVDITNEADIDTAIIANATVSNAPTNDVDVIRKKELDALQSDVNSHSSQHENGSSDEINVSGLSGELSDPQPPKDHASSHHEGGSDTIEASNLSGNNGAAAQVLRSDGTSAYWGEAGDVFVPGTTSNSGDITRSTDGSEDGFIAAENYTIQSGVTRTVNNGVCIIHATNKITIDGTLQSVGGGGNGGSGGSGGSGTDANADDGSSGQNGDYAGDGGNGGDGSSSNGDESGTSGGGGNGGSGGVDSSDVSTLNQVTLFGSEEWNEQLVKYSASAGAGGGGGGGGAGIESTGTTSGEIGPDGGDGGDGGSVILLISPEVVINGTLRSEGQDGQNGGDGTEESDGDTGAGGGGGGGSGGLISVIARSYDKSSGTVSVPGGSGGSGGSGTSTTSSGSDGQPGDSGRILEVIG